jgi:hypothetical protein
LGELEEAAEEAREEGEAMASELVEIAEAWGEASCDELFGD